MAGGRELLQGYQSYRPDPVCQRRRWAPERGWIKVSYIGSEGERTTPYKRGEISTIEAPFEDKTVRGALDSG